MKSENLPEKYAAQEEILNYPELNDDIVGIELIWI